MNNFKCEDCEAIPPFNLLMDRLENCVETNPDIICKRCGGKIVWYGGRDVQCQ